MVDTQAPTSPTLVSPDNDNADNTQTKTLDWSDSSDTWGVDNYMVYIDGSENTVVADNATTQANVDFEEGSHIWQVRVVDYAGNENYSENRVITIDITDPTVSATTPDNGATYVPLDQNVIVVFDNSMDTGVEPSLTQTAGSDPGGWTFAGWSTTTYENDTATWTHNAWTGSNSVTMQVSGYKDRAGNDNIAYSWSFSTAPSYLKLRVSEPQDNIVPFDGASDTNSNVLTTTNGGTSWTLENKQPIFILDYSDGSYEGNSYSTLDNRKVYLDNFVGENFYVTADNRATSVAVYLKRVGSPPDLRFSILDDNGTTVVDNAQIGDSGTYTTTYSWIENSNVSFMLYGGHRYVIYFSTPGGDSSSNYYEISAPTSENIGPSYETLTYDGENSFAVASSDGGSTWSSENNRDIAFKLINSTAYRTGGYVQSSWYDSADTGTSWGTITYNVTAPSGAGIGVYLQVSDDNTVGWTESGGPYLSGESAGLTGRYIRYRVYLNSDGSATPSFEDITIDWTLSTSGGGWLQLRQSSPVNENIAFDGRTLDNAMVLYKSGSWSERNYQPIYVLEVDTNANGNEDNNDGNPYDDNTPYLIYGGNYAGARFTVNDLMDLSKLVRGVDVYVSKVGSPPGALNYALYNVTDGENESTGQVATAAQVSTSWDWESVSFESLIVDGKEYILYLWTDGGDSSNYYQWMTAGRTISYASGTADSATFDGTNTYGTSWSSGSGSWSDNTRRDLVFNLLFADNFYTAGSIESSVFDAGATVSWLNMSVTATDGSGITMKYRTGTDNNPYDGGWGSWTTTSGSINESSRYIQYMLEISSSDENTTPVIHQVALSYQAAGSSAVAPDAEPAVKTWIQTTQDDFIGLRSPSAFNENIEIVPPGDVTLKAEDYWGNYFVGSSGFAMGSQIDGPNKLFSIRFQPERTENLARVRLLGQFVQAGDVIAPGDSPSNWDEDNWVRIRLYPDDGTGKPNMSGAPLSAGQGFPDKSWSWEWYMPYPRIGQYGKYGDNSDYGHRGMTMDLYELQYGTTYHLVVDSNPENTGIGKSITSLENFISYENYFTILAIKPKHENWINNRPVNTNRGVLFSKDNGTSWESSDSPSSILYNRDPMYVLDVLAPGNDPINYENYYETEGNPYYKSTDEIFQHNYIGSQFKIDNQYDRLDENYIRAGAVEFYAQRTGAQNEVSAVLLNGTTRLNEVRYEMPFDVSDRSFSWTRFTFTNPLQLWENDVFTAYVKSPASDYYANKYLSVNTMKTAWADKSGYVNAGYGGEIGTYVWSSNETAWTEVTHREVPFRLITKYVGADNFTSKVFDAGQVVDWQFLEWDETKPPATTTRIYVRVGNSPSLSGSWSGPYENGKADITGLGNYRYLQYMIELIPNSDRSAAPAVHEVRFGYRGGFGSIAIQSNYKQYEAQKWIFEGGAVILNQNDTNLMYSKPNMVTVENVDNDTNLKVSVDYLFIKKAANLTGTLMPSAKSITVYMQNDAVYTVRPADNNSPNKSSVDIVVISDYVEAWRDYFDDLSRDINNAYGATVSSVDASSISSKEVKLTINGRGSGNDILYYERTKELEVSASG